MLIRPILRSKAGIQGCSYVFLASWVLSLPVFAQGLTGNWVVRSANAVSPHPAYFDLRFEGGEITGHIRATQFYYKIVESTGGPDGFTITASMMDGANERKVQYEGKLVGGELHLGTRRRPDAPLTEQVAKRAPDGEGAYPARVAPPTLHKVADNGLGRTPPMGWNSWNKFTSRVSDELVRETADAMASNGMKAAGYVYVNIDDTWEGERDAQGNIRANSKFPDMKALADYVHGKGLKLGLYSSPGPETCAGYEGTYGHEAQDGKTYAQWGIDYLKYDWCSARNLYTDEEMQAVYQKMGDALLASGRKIFYSLCQYGRADVWAWGADVGGNAWRTTGDIRDTWDSMSRIGFAQGEHAPFANPGHFNDPDMLEIGNGGMNDDEYRTHMSLWSMLAAPLLAGNDQRNMPANILAILTNREVIAVDQDKLGKQGTRAAKNGDTEIWTRELDRGARAVALFNRGGEAANVKWSEVGLKKTPKKARDLWAHADVALSGLEYSVNVPSHGVVLLRVEQ
jgi:alpha-galactosidase